MKKLLTIIACFQMCFTVGSCQKPKPLELKPLPPLPKPPYETLSTNFPTKLEIVWNAPFHSDSTKDFFWSYEVTNDKYIVLANRFDIMYGKPRGIGVYNMPTGQQHSAWQNDPSGIFAPTEEESLDDCKMAGKNKDIILIYNRRALFGYSLHTGQRLWTATIKSQTSMGIPCISADENYAYISYNPNGALSKSWCRLAKVDVYSGKKTDILQLNIEDNHDLI